MSSVGLSLGVTSGSGVMTLPPPGAPPAEPPDMSITVGSRTISPAFPVVDASPPSPLDLGHTSSLHAYMSANVPIESEDGLRTRERVLSTLRSIVREWIRHVTLHVRRLPPEVADAAGGDLYTSGSYRLGVHEPGADIDAIVVSPTHCTREDFFDTLADRIAGRPEVANFSPVATAAVPIMTFDMDGINIDLMFAQLSTSSVGNNLDIDDDGILVGVDAATAKSLNAPRVTNLIARFVSGNAKRYDAFLLTVRCIRRWAKARGLYSNKMGYWGGVNIAIAVAFVLQLYPEASPAALLRKFFLVFKTWRWPNPVMLCRPHDVPEIGLPVWNGFVSSTGRHVAPIITPAYPAMNSTLAVSRQTLQILHSEIVRGHQIVDAIYRQAPDPTGNCWEQLFQPADFYSSYPHYISLCIVSPSTKTLQAWAGFVESRLRRLVSENLGRSLPLRKVQLWPKGIQEGCYADLAARLTQAQRKNAITYFVGFAIDRPRMRGERLDVERMLQQFGVNDLARFGQQALEQGEQPTIGNDVIVRYHRRRTLPRDLFDKETGGKNAAMLRYRKRKREDPAYKEKVRLKKLEQLKKRVEEMQRRKRERDGDIKIEKPEVPTETPNDIVSSTTLPTESQDTVSSTIPTESQDTLPPPEDSPADARGPYLDSPADAQEPPLVPSSDTLDPNAPPFCRSDALPPAAPPPRPDDDPPEDEEAALALLESALDAMQPDALVTRVTREEAERDRQRLLSGAHLDETAQAPDPAAPTEEDRIRAALEEAGCVVVSDPEEEEKPATRGGVWIPAWRRGGRRRETKAIKVETVPSAEEVRSGEETERLPRRVPVVIDLVTKFGGIIELDVNGHVIDKGDDNFLPSAKWKGRRDDFEFKLGARGLGYYRTGVPVVVPSNTSY